MTTTPITAKALRERLSALRENLTTDPLANPVRRLGHELSVELEAGRMTLSDTERLIEELSCEAAKNRRDRMRTYLGNAGTLAEAAKGWLRGVDADALSKAAASPLETIVFTGHPTFAMTRAGREAMGSDADLAPATEIRDGITLTEEHAEAREALKRAGDAAVRMSEAVIREAMTQQGDGWRTLLPLPIGLATWVGYDLDGRQDIGWPQIFRHRLIEKRDALSDYRQRLGAFSGRSSAVSGVADQLSSALEHTEQVLELFSDDDLLSTEEGVAKAANALTDPAEGRLTSLLPLVERLVDAARDMKDDDAVGLLAVAALMKHRGLGLGEIHFRLNAAQIRNAARSLLPVGRGTDLFGHTALSELNDAVASVERVRVNFRSLAHETSSARRISIAAAQILKHVDEDTPIRFLIAECENPVTVLTAVYLARRYGMEHKLDICPLFETARSFDRSRRILSVLLAQPSFREQAQLRGRIAIETGFSDAGRFMGQLPATLAIERLQSQLAEEMARQGLAELDAIVFNTHGESMGRGGHPGSILDRSAYAMSPWARSRYDQAGIILRHEISFQGGDGYAWFTEDEKADAVFAGLLKARSARDDGKDPFYERQEASLDFFNTVRAEQITLFGDEAMAMVAMGPGLSLLPPAGSRKTKRQFERRSEEDISLRSIRAISHNGSLQQIGYVANLHAGIGEAIAIEPEAYAELHETSDRFRRLMALVARAARLSDMKTLIAYMKLYDGSFWATRPISGREPGIEKACADLATHLIGDRRYFAALQIAARLRPGAIGLKKALGEMGYEDLGPGPLNLDLLHAVRIALIQHMFILGARLPQFARAAGFSREEVLGEILALSVPDAVAQLREGFPQDAGEGDRTLFNEPADTEETGTGYRDIEEQTIAPLERAFAQSRRISLAVAHHFGAHG